MIFDDYIPFSEWCRREDIPYHIAMVRYNRGTIDGCSTFGKSRNRVFVKKDFKKTDIAEHPVSDNYIPAGEWSKREKIGISALRKIVQRGIIPSKKINNKLYLNKKYTKEMWEQHKSENKKRRLDEIKKRKRLSIVKNERVIAKEIAKESKKIYKNGCGKFKLTYIINDLCENYTTDTEFVSMHDVSKYFKRDSSWYRILQDECRVEIA